MKILITGASGYLGGRLINYLSRNTTNQIVATGRTLPPPEVRAQFSMIDWRLNDNIDSLCQNCETIIHLASMNEQESEADYQTALLNNGMASLKILEAAEKAGVQRFIYMSSIKVLGDQQSGLLDENSLAQPRSSYAITHKLVEDYLLAKHQKKTIDGVVLRLSNAVGAPSFPNKNLWKLIGNDLCRQAITTGRIELNSPGEAWRNFIAIKDIEKAFDILLISPRNSLQDGIFNLGATRSMRIIDLAALIAERTEMLFERKIDLIHPQAEKNARPSLLDWKIDKLCKLGWQPQDHALTEEVDNTLRFCSVHFS